MRLSKSMIQTFTNIVFGKATLQELASSQKKSINHTSEVVQDLEKEGFVRKVSNFSTKGSRIAIEIANTNHAERLKQLVLKYPTIKFQDILGDGKLLFLAAISEDWMNKEVILDLTGLSRYSLERYIPQMKNRGIVLIRGGLFKLNEVAWLPLKEFLIAYKNSSPLKGIVRWKYQEEVLLESNQVLTSGTKTGFSVYNLNLNLISFLTFFPEKKPTKSEIFVHSLFEIQDPRTLYLTITFFLKNKLSSKKVEQLAMKYGKYTMFENLLKIIKSKQDKIVLKGLPPFERKDFKRIANMYGVKNV